MNFGQNLIFPTDFKIGLEYHKLCTLILIQIRYFHQNLILRGQPWYVLWFFKPFFKFITSKYDKKSRRKPHWFNCVMYDKKKSHELVKYGDRHAVRNSIKQSAKFVIV